MKRRLSLGVLFLLMFSMVGLSQSVDKPTRAITYEVRVCQVKDPTRAVKRLRELTNPQEKGTEGTPSSFLGTVDEAKYRDLVNFFTEEGLILAPRLQVCEGYTARIAQGSEKAGYSFEVKGNLIDEKANVGTVEATISLESWKLVADDPQGQSEVRENSGLQTICTLKDNEGMLIISGDLILYIKASIVRPTEGN